MIAISPRQLEVFCAIAGTGTVRAAAAQLGLTQPAASMALAELERLLGAPLFDRRQRRLRINEHGRRVLPRAREIVERLRQLDDPGGAAATLAVGASNTIGNYMVGELLGDFVAAHPAVHLSLRVANSAEIARAVLGYDLDVGCVEASATHPELEQIPWRRDELVVCVRADHPLARRKLVRAADLRGQRWILRELGSGTRSTFENATREVLGPLQVALELGQSEAIKQAVLAGLGIACLPRVAMTDALTSGQLVALRTPFLTLGRSLSLLLHRSRWRGAALQAFLAAAATRAH
ncbi:MAG: LysR family transcriptional regulator [Xanthomonadales bacterium]|nr:LysR family transcriptional regulator [Xanthomonadales bacterium]